MSPPLENEDAAATLRPWARMGLLALALFLLSTLAVATRLEPDARGRGTHTQLGLPPCGFLAVTGKPCPTCGMTTAFAWFVRGRYDRTLRSNLAGGFLAPATLSLGIWCLATAGRGRSVGFRSVETPLVAYVFAASAVTALSWTIRMILGGS